MKFIIVIFFALAATSSAAISSRLQIASKLISFQCGARTGANYNQIQALNFGRFGPAIIDDKAKCFANCYLERLGFIVNGQVQEKKIADALTPIVGAEAIQQVQAKCNNLKGANNCETAFLVYSCYWNDYGNLPGKTPEQPKTFSDALLERLALFIFAIRGARN